jgi:hypothetical protein
MLATMGGMKDIARVKTFVREIEGLPLDDPNRLPANSSYIPQSYE